MNTSANTPLAIVGIGCLFPKAAGPGFFWANVKNGVDCVTDVPPTHWNPEDYFDPDPKSPDRTYARRGGFLSAVEFHPMEFGIAPRDIEATDTSQLLGLVAAKQALTDAGVTFADSPKAIDRNRVSVILGVTGTLELVIPLGARLGHPKWKRAMQEAGVPADAAADAAERIAESYVPWQENSFPGLLGNVVAGRIANKLDLGGTNCVVDAACASSLSAVHLAALELQTGRADVAVTGGIDTFNDIFMFMCFSKTPALSPTGDAKPFDTAGDGTILGEGLGMVVLKRLTDAERDGDTVYAVLRGIGSSSDGKGNAIYAPSAAGQKKAILNAYRLADVTPDTIELVEAHGTGTRVGDTVEITALTDVYSNLASGDRQVAVSTQNNDPTVAPRPVGSRPLTRPWCALGSVKSQIGHTKAAAGAASLIKAALALYNKVLPPTIKVTLPVEPLRTADSPFYVNTRMRPWLPRPEHPRRAALSAFGFGGSNFHAVLEEYRPEKAAPDWDGTVELVAMSADTPEQLSVELERVPLGDWDDFARFAEASRTAFRPDAPHRLSFAVHRTLTDRPKLVAGAQTLLSSTPAKAWHTPEGVHHGVGPNPGKLAVLFPGQGSQSVGMLRDLACLFPEVLDTLAIADAAIAAQSQEDTDARRLSDRIYPPTTFDADTQQANDRALRDTRAAQPALGAVSYGAWRVLAERFGVSAAAFAGHSYGELVALAAAGCITPGDLFTLSRIRGELMAGQRDGDPGSMLAVLAPLADIEAVLKKEKLQLIVANQNAPKQTVLSGATAEIERAAAAFAGAGLRCSRLPVAAAFHSEFVADAAAPFRAALEGVTFAPATVPVFANTTAAEYPTESAAAKDLLANQLAKPVAFVEEIRALVAAGVRTFLEVGPGAVLTRLADAILAEAPTAIGAEAFALDPSGGKRSGMLDLADAFARLAARGVPLRLTAWEEDSRCRPPVPETRAGLSVPICGANHVNPRPARPPRPPILNEHANGRPATASTALAGLLPRTPTNGLARVYPMPDANASRPADPNALAQALAMTQQSLAALQRMQEQTAQLHRQFLESQESAQRTLQVLVDQQQSLLVSGLGGGLAFAPLPPMPAPTPVPLPPPIPAPVIPPAVPVMQAPAPVPAAPKPQPARTQPAPAPTAKPAAPTRTPVTDQVASVLLGVVAEKTGYPVSSLDLKLSLDSDLGVDSIKRVEILSALQEKLPHAPQVKPEHLGSLHTLQDVADFLCGAGGAAPTPEPEISDADDDVMRTLPVNAEQLELLRGEAMAAKSAGGGVDVASVLLGVVAEKTGYPVASLDLKLSLDSDLGVDSIKRVEILSALQEKLPHAPQVKPEHLGSLHTLQDVTDFLTGRSSLRTEAPLTAKLPSIPSITPPAEPSPSELLAPDTEQVSGIHPPKVPDSVLNRSQGSRIAPVPPVRTSQIGDAGGRGTPNVGERIDRSILQAVDLDPTAPRTRLPLPSGGEIWVVGDPDQLTEQVADRLAHSGLAPRVFGWSGPGANRPAGALAGLVLIAPAVVGPEFGLNQLAFEWLQQVGPKLRQAGRHGAAAFVTVARLDGAFGLGKLAPDTDPSAGGLAGLVKTARHEWPEVACKTIDLDPEFTDFEAAARALADEVLTAGPTEVGIGATHRCALELARTIRRPGTHGVGLGAQDVVLVTGGARGVTAEGAVALAEAFGSTLILTGRTPAPGTEPDWLAGLTEESEIKAAIAARLGANAGPKQIGEQYAKVMAQREVRRTLQRIEQTGAKAAYFAVDAAEGRAVADLLHKVRVKFGPVTAVVHGAGVLADKRIEDLSAADFERVYSTKVDGLRNLLDLLAHEDLKALVLFSSVTARFGRTGQLAYACANEVLNKAAQVEARRRPGCRVVAVNWGPWEGGMVTAGLKKQFESEGVGLIPLADGAAFLVHELNAAGKSVEVLALGKFRTVGSSSGTIAAPSNRSGPMPPPSTRSGVHPALVPPTPPVSTPNPDLAPAFERTVDIDSHPILRSHVLDGRAVLPLALHLEFLAHAALHGHPGLVFHGFNELRVTQAVKLDASESLSIKAYAGKAIKEDRLFKVPVELRSLRKDGKESLKSHAEIVLASALPKAPAADRPPSAPACPYSVEHAYRELLFHGPDLHGVERIDGAGEQAMLAVALPAPPPADWFQYPLRSGWVADPLVLDASFQLMCLWARNQHGITSLPNFVGRYRQFRRQFPTGPVRVVVRITRDDGTFARADIDYLDADGKVIAQMQDYECIINKTLNQAFRRNQLGAVQT